MGVTGIILAGGKSSRMGAEKGLQQLCGKPLISYAIEALSGLCDRILISSSSEAYRPFGYELIPDEFPGIGPMGGIFSTLKHSKTGENIVLSCDLPFVTTELLSFILTNSKGYQVAVPWQENQHYEPLCGFYHASVLEEIGAFIRKGNYKLPDFFETIRMNKLVIDKNSDFYSENLFFNVNSKQDMGKAAFMMEKR